MPASEGLAAGRGRRGALVRRAGKADAATESPAP